MKAIIFSFFMLFWPQVAAVSANEPGAVAAPKYFPGESWAYEAREERPAQKAAAEKVMDAAQVPVYEEGEFWVYKYTTERIDVPTSPELFESGTYRLEVKNGKVQGDLEFFQSRPAIYDPASDRKFYRFPLKLGDSWDVRYRYRNRVTGREGWGYASTRVVRSAEVTTEAGKFSGVEISREDQKGYISESVVYMYSPAAKVSVYAAVERWASGGVTSRQKIELVKYGKLTRD